MLKEILKLTELGLIPDTLVRYGIRKLCRQRLKDINRHDPEKLIANSEDYIKHCSNKKIAIETDKANEQHYELPTEFFKLVLGKHLKYSCSQYREKNLSLTEAELHTLQLYAKRAQLTDGQTILDLGCGWGSMSLYMAENFPHSNIVSVSNSKSQKEYIDEQAKLRRLKNINVITCDVNKLTFEQQFDRIISIEMLEHIKNHQRLFTILSQWTKPDGLIFIHIFSHLLAAYPFEIKDETDWMAKYFFTGGVMPADNQFLHYQQDLVIKDHWLLNGTHYEKTSNAWLKNLDAKREQILPILKSTYGDNYKIWLQRWRIFFMACAELFGYKKGTEWVVSHYLFTPR